MRSTRYLRGCGAMALDFARFVGLFTRSAFLCFEDRFHIERRVIADQEIVERCRYTTINEGAKILSEGVAAPPGGHRHGVAARLRIPALVRRSDVLGRAGGTVQRAAGHPGLSGALRAGFLDTCAAAGGMRALRRGVACARHTSAATSRIGA